MTEQYRTDDTVVSCAICGTQTTWGKARNWSSCLKPNGERFYLCAEDAALRQETVADRYPQMIERFRAERNAAITDRCEQIAASGADFVSTKHYIDDVRWLLGELDLRLHEIRQLKQEAGKP